VPPPPPPPRCLQQSPGAQDIHQHAHVAAAGGISNLPLTRAGGNSAAVSTTPVPHRATALQQQVVESRTTAANGASGSGSAALRMQSHAPAPNGASGSGSAALRAGE
jgi:hypothetical protein